MIICSKILTRTKLFRIVPSISQLTSHPSLARLAWQCDQKFSQNTKLKIGDPYDKLMELVDVGQFLFTQYAPDNAMFS